jgi:uncharacterized protein (DUF58 family)
MTRRGRAVLALALAVYLVAWVFGSRALYPVATGLAAAVVLAYAWVRLSSRPPRVRRHGAGREVLSGDDVRIDLDVSTEGALAPPTLVAVERPGRLEERVIELWRVGRRRFAGGYELRGVRRGRYAFETVRLTIEDPFGLARARLEKGEPEALVVYPRRAACTHRTAGGCCCAGRPGTSCTASATTSRGSRCAPSTGPRPRAAAG